MGKVRKVVTPKPRDLYRVRAIDSNAGIRLVRTWHRPKYVVILVVAATLSALLGIVFLLWLFDSKHDLIALVIILVDLLVVVFVTYHAFACIANQTVVDVTPTGVSVVHTPMPWRGTGFYAAANISQVTLFAGKHSFRLRLLLKSKKIVEVIDDLGSFQQAQFIQFQVARHLGMVKIKTEAVEEEPQDEESETSEAA